MIFFEPVAGELLKSAVGEGLVPDRGQARLAVVDHQRRVNHRQALRQIGIVRQGSSAVADGEKGGDQFQMILLAGLPDLIEAAEVIGRFFGKRVEAGGKDRAVQAVVAGGFEHRHDLGDVRVLFEVPTENPDKTVGVTVSGPGRNGQAEQEQGQGGREAILERGHVYGRCLCAKENLFPLQVQPQIGSVLI